MSDTYNGWKNYSTWNVMLWLNNDEALYKRKQEFYKQALRNGYVLPTYLDLVKYMNLFNLSTLDGVKFTSLKLDLPALDEEINTEFNEYKFNEYAK